MLGVFSACNKNQYRGGKVRPARGAVTCAVRIMPNVKLAMKAKNFFPDVSPRDSLRKSFTFTFTIFMNN